MPTFKQHLSPTERQELQALLATFTHTQAEDGEITAIASDGQRVSLGNLQWGQRSLLSYLRAHPTPSDW